MKPRHFICVWHLEISKDCEIRKSSEKRDDLFRSDSIYLISLNFAIVLFEFDFVFDFEIERSRRQRMEGLLCFVTMKHKTMALVLLLLL